MLNGFCFCGRSKEQPSNKCFVWKLKSIELDALAHGWPCLYKNILLSIIFYLQDTTS